MKAANHRRTPASHNRAHAGLDDSLKRKLQNADFRAAYEAEDKRIELVLQIIRLRQQRGMTQADLAKAIGYPAGQRQPAGTVRRQLDARHAGKSGPSPGRKPAH